MSNSGLPDGVDSNAMRLVLAWEVTKQAMQVADKEQMKTADGYVDTLTHIFRKAYTQLMSKPKD